MSSDVFVYWNKGKPIPTKDEVERVIVQFFGETAKAVTWDQDRFFVTLIGTWSHPLRGIADISPGLLGMGEPPYSARCLEVWPSKGSLDVITRMQDEYTNTCAMGLAKVFARYWEGELEDG
jgi:hypothetical protein